MDNSQRSSCSSAPHSSSLNTALRTRKRSRTSSAEGDGLAVNRELRKNGNNSGSDNSRSQYSKGKIQPGKRKSSRKKPKASKPKIGNLQNAVVLAPFYTLKKSFQNKLMNFYSCEKLKKITHKSKKAKKQNMSFEYDIIELKPNAVNIKKEGKTSSKSKEKPAGRCRCKGNREKTDKKLPGNNVKRNMSGKELMNSGAANLSEQLQTKRKKPNYEVETPTTLKAELGPSPNAFTPNTQSCICNPGPSSVACSSQSEGDSWETFSHPSSSKEEYIEGALAVSTSSFDCYMENFDKRGWDFDEVNNKCSKPGKNLKISEAIDMSFFEKSFKGPSKNTNFEKKISDGQILDFMDREAETQGLSIKESDRYLNPLRPPSKRKTKRPESGDRNHLQSLSSSKGRVSPNSSGGANKSKTLQVEAATQREEIEEDITEEEMPADQQMLSPDGCCENVNIPREKTPKESFSSSSSSPSLSKAEYSLEKNLPMDSVIEPGEINLTETQMQPTENPSQKFSELENSGAFCQKLPTQKP